MTYREPSRPWGLHSCLPVLGSPSSGGPHSEQHERHGPGTLPITPCRLAAALRSTYPHSVPCHPCLALGSSTWSPPAPAAASPSGLVSPPGSGGCRPHLTLWRHGLLCSLLVLSVTSDHSAVCGWASNIRGPKNLAPQRGSYHRLHPISPGARRFTRSSL